MYIDHSGNIEIGVGEVGEVGELYKDHRGIIET